MKELKPMVSLVLQKGFNFAVTLPEVNALDFVAPDHELTQMTTSAIAPMLEQQSGGVKMMLENPPLPFLGTLVEQGKTNLQCNFSVTAKVAESLVTVHFKTAGVKEILGL